MTQSKLISWVKEVGIHIGRCGLRCPMTFPSDGVGCRSCPITKIQMMIHHSNFFSLGNIPFTLLTIYSAPTMSFFPLFQHLFRKQIRSILLGFFSATICLIDLLIISAPSFPHGKPSAHSSSLAHHCHL